MRVMHVLGGGINFLDVNEVRLRDIELLRSNNAWKWLNQEWEEILVEVEGILKVENYPDIYRTQGRANSLDLILTSLDNLEELVKEQGNG